MKTIPLSDFSADQQRRFDSATSATERKERGHFGTPPAIAQFMAAMFPEITSETIRILDPGAGVGTLSAAICQQVLPHATRRSLYFEVWENDPKLIPILQETMRRCQVDLQANGHMMRFVIRDEDFVLSNTQQSLFDRGPQSSFHWVILNPPYQKLRKESPQAQAMGHVVHGQPNIYALFMAVAADLLLPGGRMVAITPRSYFNGPYFRRFRRWFFSRMRARQIHLFESRAEAFKGDSVLQENVILHAEKSHKVSDIVLTTSAGVDWKCIKQSTVPSDMVFDNTRGDQIIRVTTDDFEREVMEAIDSLPCRFSNSGFEISTGPVVTFRATQFLRNSPTQDTAPLIWMHNVRRFTTQFPDKVGKPGHIEVSASSQKLLVPSGTYVLLKRFTAKEEKRRLVAGIMTSTDSYSRWVGLENHLNYVYRREGELTTDEAFGLAAYFNSAIVDRYFRAISGNTQVNATEIRALPIPEISVIQRLGFEVKQIESKVNISIEDVVGKALRLPLQLRKKLIEVAE